MAAFRYFDRLWGKFAISRGKYQNMFTIHQLTSSSGGVIIKKTIWFILVECFLHHGR